MILKPRDYQEAAFDAILGYFQKNQSGNPLIAMPTGTGKAVVIAMLCERILKWWPGQRIMVLTHVKELINQNYQKLKVMWPQAPAGVYSSGLDRRETHFPVTFAGIGSVRKRSTAFGHHDLLIVDEAHLIGDGDSTMYMEFITRMKAINPRLRVIGLSATIWRTGMGMLTNGKIFDDVAFDMTTMDAFNWFFNEGYLKPLVPRPMDATFDLSGVKTNNTGDYNQGQLQDAVDTDSLNQAVVRETIRNAGDRKHWLAFASGVDHAIHLHQIFDSLGVPSCVVHSKMGDDQRDQTIADFLRGRYRVCVNNGILTTGFDYPELDLIAMYRPTKSSSLWVQMLGRGTRPVYAPGYDLSTRDGRHEAMYYGGAPNCMVLDFARNTPRLGPINDPVIPKKKGQGGGGGEAPVKVCPHCGSYIHASLTICPHCSGEMPRAVKIGAEAGTEALIKTANIKTPSSEEVIQTFQVHKVTYQQHVKDGAPDSIKVTYYTGPKGLQRFQEWVCLEHDKIKGRARSWWQQRAGWDKPAPLTTEEALTLIDTLKTPKEIRVRMDSKYPEVVGYADFQETKEPSNA